MRVLRFLFSRLFLCITVIAALTAAIIFLCVYIHSLLPAALAMSLAYALDLIAALHLMRGESPADFKCCWLALLTLLPVAGAALYFLSYVSKREQNKCEEIFRGCPYDGYRLYTDGAEFLEGLTVGIDAASSRVYLEFYIISKGHIWAAMYDAIVRALGRGVEVKIIYDGLGSALRAPKKDFKRLIKLGAEVKAFNKPVPLPAVRIGLRDHRKLAVIDGKTVFLGGVNIADEYAHLTAPFGFWKDGGGAFYGEIAKVYEGVFINAFCGGGKTDYARTERGAVITCDGPSRTGSAYEDMLAEKIYSARERLLIFTPYLCMGDKLGDAICYAVRRGVSVRVLIPGIPDKRLPYAISKAYAAKLTGWGAEVFLYLPGFMHFKAVVCDGGVFLGSYNFDFRSMRLNYENGIYCVGNIADEVACDFERCVAVSVPFRQKKGAAAKLIEYFVKLFAPLV